MTATAMIDSQKRLSRWAKKSTLFATVTVSLSPLDIRETLNRLNLSYRLVESDRLENTWIVSILCR